MKPILFNTKMVQAIQRDDKTVTRRVITGADPEWSFFGLDDDMSITKVGSDGLDYPKNVDGLFAIFEGWDGQTDYPVFKSRYRTGDILYVRETWAPVDGGGYIYRAGFGSDKPLWHQSIHMPKEAARIFLRVTDVRVERLQDSFTAQGATIIALQDEGIDIGDHCRQCIEYYGYPCCNDFDSNLRFDDDTGEDESGGSECGMLDRVRYKYSLLWDSTIKPADRALYGWDANPWVWAIEFERISKEEAMNDATA